MRSPLGDGGRLAAGNSLEGVLVGDFDRAHTSLHDSVALEAAQHSDRAFDGRPADSARSRRVTLARPPRLARSSAWASREGAGSCAKERTRSSALCRRRVMMSSSLSSTYMWLQNDPIMALSKQSPTNPIDGSRPESIARRVKVQERIGRTSCESPRSGNDMFG